MTLTWWLTPGVHEQPRHRMRQLTLDQLLVRFTADTDAFESAITSVAARVAAMRTGWAHSAELDRLDHQLRAVCRPEEYDDACRVVRTVEWQLRMVDWPGDPAVIARKRVLAQVTRGEVPTC